jgi:hypothetical protein
MTSKFSRFQNIERSRGERPNPEGKAGLQVGHRFESVKGPGEATQAPLAVPEAHLNRFRGEAPLALAEEPAAGPEVDFPRCARCEAENGRFSQHCHLCGADLHSAEQRAYNAKRQQAQQEAEAQHRAEVEALAQARQQAEAERQQDADRYTQMLRQQLQEEGPRGLGRRLFVDHASVGMGLLHLIPEARVRWAVLAACLAMPVLLVRYGRDKTEAMGWWLGLFMFLLFAPRWLFKTRRKRWGEGGW